MKYKDKWRIILNERHEKLKEQCGNLTNLSKDFIKATLIKAGKTGPIEKKFKELIKGTGVQGEKIDLLFQFLRKDSDPYEVWNRLINEIESLALMKIEAISSETELPHTPILDENKITSGQKKKIASKLNVDNWLELSLMDLQDVPQFEYRSREDEYIKFEDASAGQQATALMSVLLNQTGPPLIIDQPEDDLDSLVIQEIVREVWNAKNSRQIIFASHNANLVVNGDAEMVICCDYKNDGDQTMGIIRYAC